MFFFLLLLVWLRIVLLVIRMNAIIISMKVSSHSDLFVRRLVYRGQNVSILHLRSTSDPWEVGSQGSSYSVGSNKSQSGGKGKSSGNARGSYTRGTSIPSLKRHDTTASATASTSSLKQHRQDSHSQASKESKKKIFLLLLHRAPLKSRVTLSIRYL